jgi:hypothetical protein
VYTQPSRPDHDTYTHVKYDGEDNVSGKAAWTWLDSTRYCGYG